METTRGRCAAGRSLRRARFFRSAPCAPTCSSPRGSKTTWRSATRVSGRSWPGLRSSLTGGSSRPSTSTRGTSSIRRSRISPSGGRTTTTRSVSPSRSAAPPAGDSAARADEWPRILRFIGLTRWCLTPPVSDTTNSAAASSLEERPLRLRPGDADQLRLGLDEPHLLGTRLRSALAAGAARRGRIPRKTVHAVHLLGVCGRGGPGDPDVAGDGFRPDLDERAVACGCVTGQLELGCRVAADRRAVEERLRAAAARRSSRRPRRSGRRRRLA